MILDLGTAAMLEDKLDTCSPGSRGAAHGGVSSCSMSTAAETSLGSDGHFHKASITIEGNDERSSMEQESYGSGQLTSSC